MTLAVAPIVEGHGEVASVRILIQKIASHVSKDAYVEVLRPLRVPRGKLTRPKEIERAAKLATAKLRAIDAQARLILVLLDADEDCAARLGPSIAAHATRAQADVDTLCVVACVEYETWFVASAASMTDLLEVGPNEPPEAPEQSGAGKGWVRRRMRSRRYSETVDQPKLTARLDIKLCATRSPSFARLVREMAKRLEG